MERIITAKCCLEVFSGVHAGETDEQALLRARNYYQKDVADYEAIIAQDGNGEGDYWLKCLNSTKQKLESLQIETISEYIARVRESYLTEPPLEISQEKYFEMFEILPPCGYRCNKRYEMFYISEAVYLSYHTFYLHDKTTGKFWSKVGDIHDRTTWLDSVLGMKAA